MMMMMMNECSGYASVGCGISLFLSSLSEGAIKIVEEGAFRAGRQALLHFSGRVVFLWASKINYRPSRKKILEVSTLAST